MLTVFVKVDSGLCLETNYIKFHDNDMLCERGEILCRGIKLQFDLNLLSLLFIIQNI